MASTLLTVISGVSWTVVYIEIIRLGFAEKTCGMPLFALCLNIAWEFLYAIDGLFIHQLFIPAQNVANVVWACFDMLILLSWFKYGKESLPEQARSYFIPYSIIALASCIMMQLAFYLRFFDHIVVASQYSAFAQNAAMSILFLTMLFRRGNTKGQSMTIAICKCIGTLAPTILGGFIESINIYIILFGAVSFLFDVIYIVVLGNMQKQSK